MTTVLNSIEDKYSDDDEDYGFIVFVSNSPETKRGMFPCIMTLCDYDIEKVGMSGISLNRLSHIAELDLTDNLLSEWSEIILLLRMFPGLLFLNLSNNLLCDELTPEEIAQIQGLRSLIMEKLVLNGNKISWSTANQLTRCMPDLTELHLGANCLGSPDQEFSHQNVRHLFLRCNQIDDFDRLTENMCCRCPNLELMSLAECPVAAIPGAKDDLNTKLPRLYFLNLSTTKISSWEEVDKLRNFPALSELRLQNCPLLDDYTTFEKRMLLIARLPNIQILNGGDRIPANEREDAERAFIRYYLDAETKPARYDELVAVHGQLDPLVNVNMTPESHVRVQINYKDEVREEEVSVYQTVQQFKARINQWFDIAPQNMRLYYYDQVLCQVAGPEEMKWSQKALYTYNVRHGDRFIVDEKVQLNKLRISRNSTGSMSGSSPRIYGRSVSFGSSPMSPNNKEPKRRMSSQRCSRNLFGTKSSPKGN